MKKRIEKGISIKPKVRQFPSFYERYTVPIGFKEEFQKKYKGDL